MVKWKPYQSKNPGVKQLKQWFGKGKGNGFAVVCGKVSSFREVIDVDEKNGPGIVDQFFQNLKYLAVPNLLKRLVIVKTPNHGLHVHYRCSAGVGASQKLARTKGTSGNPVTLIETRGEGAYAIIPPTKDYVVIHGNLKRIFDINANERELLLSAARALNEYTEPDKTFTGATKISRSSRNRPGDDYNERADWDKILGTHGWKLVDQRSGVGYWQRPGKKPRNVCY